MEKGSLITMKKAGYDMLYLVSCALNNQKPDLGKIKECDLQKLLTMAKRHSLVAIVAVALESLGEYCTKEWLEERDKAIRKNILLSAEYNQLANYLDEQGIWYMPLKGYILKEYYPKNGMRQMADIDILFDSKYREKVNEFFKSWGYEEKSFGDSHHDVYLKQPIYNYEMHVSLYTESWNEVFYKYYSNIKEKLIKQEKCKNGYRFTNEDFYIYIISHAYKHYTGSGTGIRTIADCYVYLKCEERNMDWVYISQEFEKLGISEFEEELRHLSKKVFGDWGIETLGEVERKRLEYFLFSGTYGTMKNMVNNKINKLKKGKSVIQAKCIYFLKRIFPGKGVLQVYCPYVAKYKILLPYAWTKRMVKGIVFKHKSIVNEMRCINKV